MNVNHITALEGHLNDILDLMEVGIFLSDRQGTTLRVNKAYESLTGIARERLEGFNVLDLQKQGIFNKVLNPVIVKTGKPATAVQEFGRGEKTLHLQSYPIFGSRGEVCFVVTFARDVTTIRSLQSQIDKQARLIQQYQARVETMLGSHRKIDGVFSSPPMQMLLTTMMRIAATDVTVLLLGETGTGKDVLARIIHASSPRKDSVFIKVDCSSISEQLIESELFGYVKGAFTGASAQGKAGYFESADGGTLFLDEIGELPLPMQSRLLRVLQDQEIMRVGSSKAQKVDVRIIAATNRDLSADIEAGKFRQDLFYRLDVAKLIMPPLRERLEDIPLLTKHFLDKYNAKYNKSVVLSQKALKALSYYSWPGNVRELQNIIQHIVITHDNVMVEPSSLPGRLRECLADKEDFSEPEEVTPALPETPTSLKEVMEGIEAELLAKAVQHYGSFNKTAQMFQINRSTLFRKLKRSRAYGSCVGDEDCL